jgi:hypothetical protein
MTEAGTYVLKKLAESATECSPAEKHANMPRFYDQRENARYSNG